MADAIEDCYVVQGGITFELNTTAMTIAQVGLITKLMEKNFPSVSTQTTRTGDRYSVSYFIELGLKRVRPQDLERIAESLKEALERLAIKR